MQLNVGGRIFQTEWSTIRRPFCSKLSRLSYSDKNYDQEKKEFFFDRSSTIFEQVLDLHRTGAMHIPEVCYLFILLL